MENYRIYGKRTEIANDYYEVEYIEFREDGSPKCTGTEDFTSQRWSKQTKSYECWSWDGHRLNKGGHRWFDFHGCKRATNRAAIMMYLRYKHPDAEVVQAR